MNIRKRASRLLFLCLVGGIPASLFAASAVIDDVRGKVEKRGVGALGWQKVIPGEKIEEGTSLRSAANSQAVVITEQGHRFTVRAETTIEFTSLQADETKTRLETGRVISKVQKLKAAEKFSLQTPTAVCAVRGTEFDTMSGQGGTFVSVYHGVVGVAATGSTEEVRVLAGQMTSVRNGAIELPRPIPQGSGNPTTQADNALAKTARHEVGLDMTRNEIIAAAATERRYADYQEGKSLTDVEGKRVRIDEYIVRPAANQFKLVALNERENRLDYFFYQGTFNKNLPTDLSVALRDISGKFGTTAPEYYLTAYEMGQSNTQDSIHDLASGGHRVRIDIDGSGNYTLTEYDENGVATANTRTVERAEQVLDGNGDWTGDYTVYNPLVDSFVVVSAAELAANTQFGIYISENDTFRDLAAGDTIWKTRFNDYTHDINDHNKITYTKSGANNTLVASLDATYTYAGGFVLPVVETDPLTLDSTITNYYGDGTFERYRTVLIDDDGKIAPQSAFSGLSTGAEYKGELLKWNYQQQVTASEFDGRKIDLVVEPKIFIKSGLIQ